MNTLKSGICFNCGSHIGYKLEICKDCAFKLVNDIEADMKIEEDMMLRA